MITRTLSRLLVGSLLLAVSGYAMAEAPKPAKSGYEFVKEETRRMMKSKTRVILRLSKGASCLIKNLLRENHALVATVKKAKSWT